ncbi:MAG: hypothetical protein K0B52_00785 [FCB group bacterium]|nr:hypothetical protein [FCB group bacterium]
MKKYYFVVILICLMMAACFFPVDNDIWTEGFSLADTRGNPATVFTSVGSFRIRFMIVNVLEDTLTFGYPMGVPIVRFEITRDDSVIATSEDGNSYIGLPAVYFFCPGDTIRAEWLAPTTPDQFPKVVLAPGTYKARVISRLFDLEEISAPEDIAFSVIQ